MKKGDNVDKNKKEKIEELEELFSYLGKLIGSLVEEEPAGFNAEEIGTVVSDNVDAKAEAGLTFEQVRSILGQKTEDGFTEQVHELLKKFGAKMLSQVDPKDYKALLKQVEDLKHA